MNPPALSDNPVDDPAAGLSSDEVEQRRATYGPNRLVDPPRRPAWLRFVDQFRSGIVYVLIAAAGVAGIVGDAKDTVVIAVVLVINAILGYLQEAKAENALDALRTMLVAQVRARRDGRLVQVPVDDLVPGDVVVLEAGDMVPADGELLVAVRLAVDESMLTGESVPVDKAAIRDPGQPEPEGAGDERDRSGQLAMHATVVRGRAEMLVTATGMNTAIGRIAGMLVEADPGPTPLQKVLDRLGKQLATIAVIATSVVFLLQVIRGDSVSDALLGAVVLAVAAIPEGLPAVVTVTLAVGVSGMARRGAIVKRLHSVETLGSTTVICSDKTGTLTRNQMTARVLVVGGGQLSISGDGYDLEGGFTPAPDPGSPTSGPDGDVLPDLVRALLPGVLCSEAAVSENSDGVVTVVGDPTEAALVVAGVKAGVDGRSEGSRLVRVAEIPFDSASKIMVTVHRVSSGVGAGHPTDVAAGLGEGDVVLFVKGAPEIVMDLCSRQSSYRAGVVPFGSDERSEADRINADLSARGLRVLALASKTIRGIDAFDAFDEDGELTDPQVLLGDLVLESLVAVMDPPRSEVRDAVALCATAGIAVKMITGDNVMTAASIARDLGIVGRAVTGVELDAMDDEALAREVDAIGVFARVSPEHKVRVVDALKANGHVVAMTGDGVNDAAALRSADIGVAMGITGTEVTKEAGDMVLTDDNFATIVDAVERGRTIYDNIIKFVRFQLSTNLGAISTVLAASLLGMPTPFTPVQVLWVNLIADGPPAMTLGVDQPGPGAMTRPPRAQDESILGRRRVSRLMFFGVIMAVGTLSVYSYAENRWGRAVAGTMAFNTFVFFQMFNVFNARRENGSVFSRYSLTNMSVWVAVGAVCLLQVAAVRWGPMMSLFDTEPISLAKWACCVAVASSVLWLEEARKAVVRYRARPTGKCVDEI